MIIANFLVGLGCTTCQSGPVVHTVPNVDLVQYSGTWFEIASYPQFFERGCVNVKATYTPMKDYIEVYNQSVKNGMANDIKGKAFIVKNSGNAKLKVQFVWPFKGDYWIIKLADDYSWAVVSDSKRSTLWILSRTPKMEPVLYQQIVADISKEGFDINKIVKMVQQ